MGSYDAGMDNPITAATRQLCRTCADGLSRPVRILGARRAERFHNADRRRRDNRGYFRSRRKWRQRPPALIKLFTPALAVGHVRKTERAFMEAAAAVAAMIRLFIFRPRDIASAYGWRLAAS